MIDGRLSVLRRSGIRWDWIDVFSVMSDGMR